MARPLRIHLPTAWYHVTARGNERRVIFRDDSDRRHFVELLAELSSRFGCRLHAWVLMDNHYHLLLEPRREPLSVPMQWLNVSYTVWFNRRHRRVGHLLQGRFKAIVVDRVQWGLALSRYVHLNPVRIGRLGLDKRRQQLGRAGLVERASAELIRERIRLLRGYQWSSYRSYVGLGASPPWLESEGVLALVGGDSRGRQAKAYRAYVERAVREGWEESPWEQLEAGLALGGAEFVNRVRKLARGKEREQPQMRGLRERSSFEQVVGVVEELKGEKWEAFRDRYGDWGRDLALYLGRKRCGMKLRELGEAAGGMDYGSVSEAVKRFERQTRPGGKLATISDQAEARLLKI